MKITEMVIDNILKLRAIHIIPKSEMVDLKGDNAMGKSSILDSIVIAFSGDRALPPKPIRKGAKKGTIKLSLDGDAATDIPPFTITRTLTEKGAYVSIEPTDILSGETPRSFLDKLVGKVSFDPLSFIDKDSKDQRKILLELLDINVDELDKKEKEIFDNRTIAGRELKTAEAKMKGLQLHTDITETQEIKVSDISTKLSEAMVRNQDISLRIQKNQVLKDSALRDKETIESLRKQIEELEKTVADKRERYNAEKEALAKIDFTDTESISKELSEIEDKNVKIRNNINYRSEQSNLKLKKDAYDKLDNKLECVREERINLLSGAAMPVPGLTFSEDGLLYNSLPLSQASDAEKIEVGIGICMALNPTVRVIRIKDWSKVGPSIRNRVRKIAQEKDFQVWTESVMGREEYDKSGKIGIFIEEGVAEGDEVVTECEEEVKKDTKEKEDDVQDAVVTKNTQDEDW